MPIITRRTIAAIQPTTHVKTALPVEKSKACFTAITMATKPQTHTTKDSNPPTIGTKLNIRRIPGELEKPNVLRSSAKDAVPPKTFVPIK